MFEVLGNFYPDGFFDLRSDITCVERPNAFSYWFSKFHLQMHCSAPWPLSSTMLNCLTVMLHWSAKCIFHSHVVTVHYDLCVKSVVSELSKQTRHWSLYLEVLWYVFSSLDSVLQIWSFKTYPVMFWLRPFCLRAEYCSFLCSFFLLPIMLSNMTQKVWGFFNSEEKKH